MDRVALQLPPLQDIPLGVEVTEPPVPTVTVSCLVVLAVVVVTDAVVVVVVPPPPPPPDEVALALPPPPHPASTTIAHNVRVMQRNHDVRADKPLCAARLWEFFEIVFIISFLLVRIIQCCTSGKPGSIL
jgi:hypothetical protein